MAYEFKIKNSLQILNTIPVSGIYDTSIAFNGDSSTNQSLATINATQDYIGAYTKSSLYIDGSLNAKTSFSYVDSSLNTKLKKTTDTFTGILTIDGSINIGKTVYFNNDPSIYIKFDVGNNLIFSDKVIGVKTLTELAAGGGSSATSYFDATVGTGGDYTEPADAFAAGKRRIKFLSNVSATKSTVFTGFAILDTNGFIFTFTGQTFTLSSETTLYGKYTGSLTIANNSVILNAIILTGTLTLSADYCKISKCIISSTLTISAGAEYNNISDNTITGGLTNATPNITNVISRNI